MLVSKTSDGSSILSPPAKRKELMFIKYPNIKYTLKDNLARLDEISKFEKNWNLYDADPLPTEVIEEARRILIDLDKVGLPQPFVAPTAAYAIQFEWDNDCFYLEMEVKPAKELKIFMADEDDVDKGLPMTMEGKVRNDADLTHIKRLVKKFHANMSS